MATRFGTFFVVATDKVVVEIILPGSSVRPSSAAVMVESPSVGHPLAEGVALIRKWEDGEDVRITARFKPQGTPFQQEVWKALAKVPRGTVVTYGELAQMIGRPGAARAVGRAMATNPIPLLIPCHRVIAAGGRVGGYGGSEGLKRKLLSAEGVEVR